MKQDELSRIRIVTETEMTLQGYQHIDIDTIHSYVGDLQSILDESDVVQRKAFLRSFVKKVVVGKEEVKLHYALPMPPDVKREQSVGVLPIDTLGGAGGIRTPYLLTASQTFSQVNYGPKKVAI